MAEYEVEWEGQEIEDDGMPAIEFLTAIRDNAKLSSKATHDELRNIGVPSNPAMVLMLQIESLVDFILTPKAKVVWETEFHRRVNDDLSQMLTEARKPKLIKP